MRGEHLVGVPAEHRAHAGGGERARGGHFAASDGCQADGGLGGEHSGERGGSDLADAVAGDHAHVVEGQMFGREQRRRDQQWLGFGGVADLVGVGGDTQMGQICATEGGPPPQTRSAFRQFQPR